VLREYGLRAMARAVPITRLDDAWSPVTERRVGTGMTLRALCAAAALE
jgi:hypothetical protein